MWLVCYDSCQEKGMAEDAFGKALKRRRQISITVTGRRTGRAITIPVWFVSDDRALRLLPVYGSHTQWYRNLKKDRAITIQAGAERMDLHARLLKEARAVSNVIRQFREKYTPEEIKRWYTGLDVAVQILLPPTGGSK
jgi:deazaflavin-dependent oxidoreductase (nitroreductase family)